MQQPSNARRDFAAELTATARAGFTNAHVDVVNGRAWLIVADSQFELGGTPREARTRLAEHLAVLAGTPRAVPDGKMHHTIHCPFCGSRESSFDAKEGRVVCGLCGALGPLPKAGGQERAIAAWNCRPTSQRTS